MNHTSHYQLSQWAGTDRILRADFNSDNSKIDAALAGLQAGIDGAKSGAASALDAAKASLISTISSTKTSLESQISSLDSRKVEKVTLLSRTFTPSGNSYSISVNGTAWGQCLAVLINIQSGGSDACNLRVNGLDDGVRFVGNSGPFSGEGLAWLNRNVRTLLAAFPMRDGDAKVFLLGVGGDVQSGYCQTTYNNMTRLTLSGGVLSGTWKITVIGLR